MGDETIKPVRKAVIPVAGLGSRFLPATKALAKEAFPVVDRPAIQYAVEEAEAAGITQILFVSTPEKSALLRHFEQNLSLEGQLEAAGKAGIVTKLRATNREPGIIQEVYQNTANGLGDAVLHARDWVGDEPFAVLLPDDIFLEPESGGKRCMQELVEIYNEVGGNVIAVEDVSAEDTARYGIVDIEADKGNIVSIKGLVEKPDPSKAPSRTAIMGRYVVLPKVFDHLAKGIRGAGNEIQLTDALASMIGAHPFHGVRYTGDRFDCGTIPGYIHALAAIGLRHPEYKKQTRELLKTLNL